MNHANEIIEQKDRADGVARFTATHHENIIQMLQDEHEWVGRYRCFLEAYIGQLCSLIRLQKFNGDRKLEL